MERAEEYILKHIQRKYAIPKDIDVYSLDYIDKGYIDSLALIKFIIELEDEFGIEFSDDELGSSSIKTVGGLIKLVERKTA